MRKTIVSIFISIGIWGCHPFDSSKIKNAHEVQQNNAFVDSSYNLVRQLSSLQKNCLDFSDLYSTISSSESYENSLIGEKFQWLNNLHKSDSIHFARADELKPICKLFENDSILSVVFTDMYDYKQALHVFNFSKTSFKPTSSFILYSVGGDAEDFWNTDARRIDSLTYILIETEGRVNNIETADTTFFDFRKTTKVSINNRTGKISKEMEQMDENIIEIK